MNKDAQLNLTGLPIKLKKKIQNEIARKKKNALKEYMKQYMEKKGQEVKSKSNFHITQQKLTGLLEQGLDPSTLFEYLIPKSEKQLLVKTQQMYRKKAQSLETNRKQSPPRTLKVKIKSSHQGQSQKQSERSRFYPSNFDRTDTLASNE